jgi:glycosyltransferase involved in cell wall biosynthesis
MRKVLFIAYFFPPMGGSGVQRSIKFVKYLADFGFQPIVLTVNPLFTRWIKDKSLLKDIPKETIIYRTFTCDLNWLYKLLWGLRLNKFVEWLQFNLLIPDSEKTWVPFAKKKLQAISANHSIDLAYITGPPFSSMLLGPYLISKYQIPYVVDFRDEWTNNPYVADRNIAHKAVRQNLALESSVLENCSGVIYTHPKYMRENFQRAYPFLNNKNSKVIPNGFDEDDFAFSRPAVSKQKSKLRIVYTGTFYGRRQPDILWEALHLLSETSRVNTDKIEVIIIGKNSKSYVLGKYFNNPNIESMVKLCEQVSFGESLIELISADLLLIFIAPGHNSQAEMPGKVFEYLRSYKPILAIVPQDGAASEIIKRSGTGFICDSADVVDIKKTILQVYDAWENGKLSVCPDKIYIRGFNRKAQTGELVSLFNEVLDHAAKSSDG